MIVEKNTIAAFNQLHLADHKRKFEYAASGIDNIDDILQKLIAFQVAIPSWALGTGGTRFGRFSGSGEPRSLEEKMEDLGYSRELYSH
jgi:L-rhamnose isomerase / sugar isomerase